jgi:hypothetical protein
MRRVTAILSVAAVVLMAAGLAAQAKPSFAGEWKIAADPAADGDGGRAGGPGIDLTITQGAAAMTLEYRSTGQTPAPVKLTYALHGELPRINERVLRKNPESRPMSARRFVRYTARPAVDPPPSHA